MAVKAQDALTIVDLNDVKYVKTWYRLMLTGSVPTDLPSGTTIDDDPSGTDATAGWVDEEPGYVAGYLLYTAVQNVFGDDSCIWEPYQLSSSYQAAVNANANADAAQAAAAAASAAAAAAAAAAEQAKAEARAAQADAVTGISAAGQAQLAASAAQESAEAIASHFWADDNGVHIASAPDDAAAGENVLMTSTGFTIRSGTTPRAAWSADSVEFYDANGNQAASFGQTVILQSVPESAADPTFIVELSAESGIRLMQMLSGRMTTNVRIHGSLAYMPTLQITNELQFGKTPGTAKFAWIPRQNGGLSLKWVGE